jgi:hypothetical protein
MDTIEISPEALEARQLFNLYCYPKSPFWKNEAARQAALAMLGTGIFGDNELKGHARRKDNYQVDLGNLIKELVDLYMWFAYPPPIAFVKEDIVDTFNHHFSFVSAIAQLAGVKESDIDGQWEKWQGRLSKAVDDRKISPDWRRLIEEKMLEGRRYHPKKMAYIFADILLSYCLLARPNTIADWVNAILISLGQKHFSKSSLRDYIKLEQEKEKKRISEAGGDYQNYQRHLQIRF